MCGRSCIKFTLYFMAFVFLICGIASVAVGFVSGGDALIKAAGYKAQFQVGFLIIAVFFIITTFTTILAAKKSFCLWGLLNFIFTLVIGVTFLALGTGAVYIKQTEIDHADCSNIQFDLLKKTISAYDSYSMIQEKTLCSNDCPCAVQPGAIRDYLEGQDAVISDTGVTRF